MKNSTLLLGFGLFFLLFTACQNDQTPKETEQETTHSEIIDSTSIVGKWKFADAEFKKGLSDEDKIMFEKTKLSFAPNTYSFDESGNFLIEVPNALDPQKSKIVTKKWAKDGNKYLIIDQDTIPAEIINGTLQITEKEVVIKLIRK